jgi:transcriptional regulator with XRE-family HTH domain
MTIELPGSVPAEVKASVPYAEPVTQGAEPQAEAAWWRYVVTITGDVAQKEIARATGIDQSSISRWQRGSSTPRAEAVVALARAYGRSPVEALVAAGYLLSSEVGVVELTTLTGDLTGVSVDSLLNELRRRVLGAGRQEAEGWPAGWSADNPTVGRPEDVQEGGDLIG